MDKASKRPGTQDVRPASADADRLRSDVDRHILRGLAAEWELAIALLPESLRRSIRRPLFAIRDYRRQLGCWHCGRREISLSREIIDAGRWDDLMEVLRHEIAHQVAHEGLGAVHEPAHGRGFRKACDLLRANPAASGTYRPLHARLARGEHLSGRDRILAKIHKLMALAESSNPNEAHAALRKAHDLIRGHHVDLIERGEAQDYHSVFIGSPRLRHFREAYHLAHLLTDFYFVQGIWIQAWVLEKDKMGRVLEISGTRTNILIAEHVHATIQAYIRTTWSDYRRGKRLNRSRQTDYAIGVIAGFRTTLEQTRTTDAVDEGPRLPVAAQDRALTRYVAQRYPHLRSLSRKGPGHDPQVLADGRQKGRQLIVARGITGSDGYGQRRIGYDP